MADKIGIKKMRRNTRDRNPIHACENCGCTRFSPCTCAKGAKWERLQRERAERKQERDK